MTHTPGPWTVEGKAGYEAPVIRGNGRAIAKVLYDGGSEDREVDDNAVLIAAAPELLAAAKLIREETPRAYPACQCERCIAVRQLDAIIAQAEGGAQ